MKRSELMEALKKFLTEQDIILGEDCSASDRIRDYLNEVQKEGLYDFDPEDKPIEYNTFGGGYGDREDSEVKVQSWEPLSPPKPFIFTLSKGGILIARKEFNGLTFKNGETIEAKWTFSIS